MEVPVRGEMASVSVPSSQQSAMGGKIISTLASSYADNDIRDSLRLLDLRGYEVTDKSRRNMKLDIDRDVRRLNSEIVSDFGRVAEQLKRVGVMVSKLNSCCEVIRSQIDASHAETRQVTKEASSLLKQKQEFETKQALLKAFRATYVMSEDEIGALTSSAEPVSDSFFEALARTKAIHRDCDVLLGEENQRIGVELMDQTSRHLNLAHQKLYRHVQREFKSLDFEEPHISPLLRRSLRVLAERPALFQSCLDSCAEAREHVIPDAFQAALTGRNAQGEPTSDKPIELAAADPLRYVGDMLAWTHAAVASERETLESIFLSDQAEITKNLQIGMQNQPWSGADGDDGGASAVFDGISAISLLVNHNIRGVARTLRQRIEQVIRASEEATLSFQLSNLLTFYRQIFSRILGETSDFLPTLTELSQSSLRHFRLLVRDDLLALQSDLPDIEDDLSAPAFLTSTLASLDTLLRSFDTSLDPGAPLGSEAPESAIAPILAEALTPFLDVALSLPPGPNLPAPDHAIYRLNCLLALGPVLSPFPFTHPHLRALAPRLSALTAELADAQHAFLLHSSGLHPLLAALADPDVCGEPPTASQLRKLPEHPAFASEALEEAARCLDAFLPGAVVDAKARLACLADAELAGRVAALGIERFLEDFEFVERRMAESDAEVLEMRLDEEENEGEEEREEGSLLRDVFPRTSGEVRVLLG